jgi:predicted alpha/beta-fold hydrolase
LRYAALAPDARVQAVAALCSPIDLGAVADAFDAPLVSPYRPYVLGSLRRIHAATAARGRSKTDAQAALAVKRIRHWDELVVAPRFGFESAEQYYRSMSVAPLLDGLAIPALYVGTEHDPMVPKAAVAPFLPNLPQLEIQWLRRGGHIGFPPRASFASDSESDGAGIDTEILRWLAARAAA